MKRFWMLAGVMTVWVAAPLGAQACTPSPDIQARPQFYEDMILQEATVLFRGVVQDFRQQGGQYGDVTLTIRTTRTYWGRNVPASIAIPAEYFISCPRGNLHFAVDAYGETAAFPRVSNGLGVTVLGRPQDTDEPWNFIILVDGAPDTQRVLSRFRDLKRAQD